MTPSEFIDFLERELYPIIAMIPKKPLYPKLYFHAYGNELLYRNAIKCFLLKEIPLHYEADLKDILPKK